MRNNMETEHVNDYSTVRLVTLRKLDALQPELRTAMNHYGTSVASTVFIKAMIEAPKLANEVDELRRKYRQLVSEHNELKQTVETYFAIQNKIKSLTNQ